MKLLGGINYQPVLLNVTVRLLNVTVRMLTSTTSKDVAIARAIAPLSKQIYCKAAKSSDTVVARHELEVLVTNGDNQ